MAQAHDVAVPCGLCGVSATVAWRALAYRDMQLSKKLKIKIKKNILKNRVYGSRKIVERLIENRVSIQRVIV